MAWELPSYKFTPDVAAADLSTKQFLFVKQTSSGINVAGDGEVSCGVLQNAPAAGYACEVEGFGVTKVYASAAIAKGANIASDATGKAATAASGEYVQGFALEAAGGDGELMTVFLRPQGRLA